MNAGSISMSTSGLRAILREAENVELGVVVRVAEDIYGPGGSVFIAANSKLTVRHLSWLEQRNPVAGQRPTYVGVVITHETRARRGGTDYRGAEEPADSARQRRRQATEISRDVVTRADDVARVATEVYRIVGDAAFTDSALRNRDVVANLQELNERIVQFHRSVHAAIDEYLVGNTLIMDLIAKHDLATRAVQHGLNVAVFATEIASQVVLKSPARGGELGGYYAELTEIQARQRLGDESRALTGDTDDHSTSPQWQLFQRDLAEIFLGGFLHDCGLWKDSDGDSHEAAGARLIWTIPEIDQFLPSLTKIVLFHSDVMRIASRPALVQVVEHADDPHRSTFAGEYYRTVEDARTAVKLRGRQAEILDVADLHKTLPVALAEHCVSQTEGFNARSRIEVVSRLAASARDGLYLTYVVALCNAQVEVVAPRRSYVELSGSLVVGGQRLNVDGFEGGSMWHSDDMYSPHLILLFGVDAEGGKQRLEYISPHDSKLWSGALAAGQRVYIPAGRHRSTIAVRVTGFMSDDVFANILGEYELELKRQVQA